MVISGFRRDSTTINIYRAKSRTIHHKTVYFIFMSKLGMFCTMLLVFNGNL